MLLADLSLHLRFSGGSGIAGEFKKQIEIKLTFLYRNVKIVRFSNHKLF